MQFVMICKNTANNNSNSNKNNSSRIIYYFILAVGFEVFKQCEYRLWSSGLLHLAASWMGAYIQRSIVPSLSWLKPQNIDIQPKCCQDTTSQTATIFILATVINKTTVHTIHKFNTTIFILNWKPHLLPYTSVLRDEKSRNKVCVGVEENRTFVCIYLALRNEKFQKIPMCTQALIAWGVKSVIPYLNLSI